MVNNKLTMLVAIKAFGFSYIELFNLNKNYSEDQFLDHTRRDLSKLLGDNYTNLDELEKYPSKYLVKIGEGLLV